MEGWERNSVFLDSEFILPDLDPDIDDFINPNYLNVLKIGPKPRNRKENMETKVEIKEEEVKVNVSELFVGKTIEENIQTILRTGFFLVHNQPIGIPDQGQGQTHSILEVQAQMRKERSQIRSRQSYERKRHNETPEQRTIRNSADAERKRKRLANETPEQRSKRLALRRRNLANETEEQRKARLAAKVERHRKQVANETSEQRTERLARHAESARKYLANESPKQRATRLARHAEKNLEERTCEECGKSLSTSTSLQRHMRVHAEQKKFNCKEPGCEKSFTSLFRFNLHMATHARDTIECEYCGKRYAGKKGLRRHRLRIHSMAEERKFKCDHCEKTFALQTDCRSHIFKTHSKKKRFI